MITNPIYIGKLRYQGKVYDAEHDGIISLELWQKAQETLKANKRIAPQRTTNSVKPFVGLVYCGNCNAPIFLSKAVKKNGREYVYYVCQKDDRRANATCPVHRVPAEHLEQERILKSLTAIKCWIALLLYRVYCVGQAGKFKWNVKMFRNSL